MRLTIVGTGLIGASAGMAARSFAGARVVGFDASPEHARLALERGALDAVADSLQEAVVGSDIVILAPPVDRIAALCEEIAPYLGDETVVTDVGSAKAEVVASADRVLGRRFVGGHPMAGSERHGPQAGDETLFEGASWIL